MIKKVGSVAVVVSNGKKSADWFKEKLGFNLVDSDGHWITVAPPGWPGVLHLCESKTLEPGNTGIAFYCDDLESTYKELKAKGVEFSKELKKESWGSSAMVKDPDGNEFWLV